MAELRLEGVTKRYGATTALDDLSLEVADGAFFVLLGPTGAGKTTTLRLIAGLERPDAGTIAIGGRDVGGWSVAERDIALVFQYYSLYPRYSVRQNLEFPLKSRVRRFAQAEIDARVARAARTLRIEHLLERKTDRLSGGEMQRVSIGRAIVREPQAFLMDEPLSNLDAKLREALRSELKDLQMQLGATFLFVTHDQVEAMSMGDRVAVLNEGRIAQVGTPQEIYNRPRDIFVAGFVGSPPMNLLDAELEDGRLRALAGALDLPLDGALRERLGGRSGAVTLGIRAENIAVGTPGTAGATPATVHHVENHGVEQIVTLSAAGRLINATVPASLPVAWDAPVGLAWDTGRLHLFDRESGRNLA